MILRSLRADEIASAECRALVAAGAVLAMDDRVLAMEAMLGGPEGSAAPAGSNTSQHHVADVRVLGDAGCAIHGAEVTLTTGSACDDDAAMTDSKGRALVRLPDAQTRSESSLSASAKGYWSRRIDRPVLAAYDSARPVTNTVRLVPLSGPAIDSPCWGTEAMGLDAAADTTILGTRAVRIAVVTLGFLPKTSVQTCDRVAAPDQTAALATPNGRDAKGDVFTPLSRALSSILKETTPASVVDQVQLASSARLSDLLAEIEACLTRKTDVICLCVGLSAPNDVLRRAVARVRSKGVLILSPAGRCAAHAPYPALLPEVLGVGSLGQKGAVPLDCPHYRLTGEVSEVGYCVPRGQLTGGGVDLVGPGLGLIVDGTIWSGAIFAAAFATAFVARLVQADAALAKADRTLTRSQAMITALRRNCTDTGLGAQAQGWGLPVWGGQSMCPRPTSRERLLERQAHAILHASRPDAD